MKVKMKHNKKRNTAFLYEALVRQMTKHVLEENETGRKEVVSIVKEFFSKGRPLAEELRIYQAITKCENVKPNLLEKIIAEAKHSHARLDHNEVFNQQGKLISVINRKFGKSFYNSPVQNYRNLASIAAIFNPETPIKTRVLLENNLVESISSQQKKQEAQNEMIGTPVLMNTFLSKFNDKYGSLYEEQKCLLNTYIISMADDGLSMKAFLNEEITRLETIIQESLKLEEVSSDADMRQGSEKVIALIQELKKKPLTEEGLGTLLKIQTLAREVQS
tara:strand:- start:447 stop:1274 length:828 start_codon:yes stop_codon:yes gene_type:complete